jgi:hypothetical protein
MPDTKRQKIVSAVVARLQEIRVEAGYQTDVGARVEDWRTNWDESELPAISVCDLPEQSEKGEKDAKKTTHDLPVHVRIFVRTNTPAAELRKMIGDVQQAVKKDLRWGKLALDTMPKQSGFVIPEDSFVIAGGAVEFIVQYMTDTFDPFQ